MRFVGGPKDGQECDREVSEGFVYAELAMPERVISFYRRTENVLVFQRSEPYDPKAQQVAESEGGDG